MKFGGSFYSNFSNANGSKNMDYAKDVLLDEIARLIELDRANVILILKDSGYKLPKNATKKQVIDTVVTALYSKPQFQIDAAKLIVSSNAGEYSNAGGGAEPSASGAGQGAGKVTISDPVGAIAGAIGAIFQLGAASKNQKAEEERSKQELYNKLLGDDQKTDWVPIVVIGSVFIIGAIAMIFTLRSNTAKA